MHYKVSLVAGALLGIIYAFQSLYEDFMYTFSNAFPPFIAGATVVAAFLCTRRYVGNLRLRFSLVWVCFAAGVTLWFLGEVGWSVYTLVLGIEVPYPSLADGFWLAAYAPIFTALLLYVRPFLMALTKRVVGVVVVAIIVLCTLVSTFLIPLVVAAQKDLAVLLIDLAYPLLDLILLSLAVLGLAVFYEGSLGKSWLLISLALIFDGVADILFSYTTLQGTYFNGHPLELFYHWGYILYTLAFYVHMKEF